MAWKDAGYIVLNFDPSLDLHSINSMTLIKMYTVNVEIFAWG